jgi:hypothetical protein
LSEEHLATKLAKLEGKLMMKNQELEEYREQAQMQMEMLQERVIELEKALDRVAVIYELCWALSAPSFALQ